MHSPSSYTRATTTNSEILKELQAILNMGNRHRFHVKWKALKIFQGVDIDPYDVAGWLLAGEVDDPWRHSTRPADSSALALIHLVAYVDNDVYHFHWCLRFRRFLCRRQVPLFLGYYQSSQNPLSIEATCRDYVVRNGSMLPLCSMLKVASRRRVSALSCAL